MMQFSQIYPSSRMSIQGSKQFFKSKLLSRISLMCTPSLTSMSTDQENASTSDGTEPKCIFCRIANRTMKPPVEILYEKGNFCVFRDHRPVAKNHLLIIPKYHVGSVKYLEKDEVGMITQMKEIGLEALEQVAGPEALDDVLDGFHWPPFNTIDHLHLHVISPAKEMSLWGRIQFKQKSLWFTTAEDTIKWIQEHR